MPSWVHDHHLAVLDLAHEIGADDVECAGLRGKYPRFAEFAEHEWPDAVGISRADQLLVGQADQGIGALHLEQSLDEFLDEALLLAAGDEVEDHFGIGGRLADGAFLDQGVAQGKGIGEVAVMAEREAAGVEIDE